MTRFPLFLSTYEEKRANNLLLLFFNPFLLCGSLKIACLKKRAYFHATPVLAVSKNLCIFLRQLSNLFFVVQRKYMG